MKRSPFIFIALATLILSVGLLFPVMYSVIEAVPLVYIIIGLSVALFVVSFIFFFKERKSEIKWVRIVAKSGIGIDLILLFLGIYFLMAVIAALNFPNIFV